LLRPWSVNKLVAARLTSMTARMRGRLCDPFVGWTRDHLVDGISADVRNLSPCPSCRNFLICLNPVHIGQIGVCRAFTCPPTHLVRIFSAQMSSQSSSAALAQQRLRIARTARRSVHVCKARYASTHKIYTDPSSILIPLLQPRTSTPQAAVSHGRHHNPPYFEVEAFL
jgi:hypothetical protein